MLAPHMQALPVARRKDLDYDPFEMSEPSIALFYGDQYRCEEALAARDAAIGKPERITRFGDELDIKAFSIEISTGSLFSPRRHFVLRHAEAVKPLRALYPLLAQPLPSGTFLTFIAAEGKGIEALIKKVQREGKVQGFPRPRGKALEKAVAAILSEVGVTLPRTTLAELIDRSGGDLLFIREEARKLAAYLAGEKSKGTEVAKLFYSGGEESIYPLLDRFGARDLRGTLTGLGKLHEAPSRLFPALLRHLTRLTAVRVLKDGGLPSDKIASELGLPEWLSRRIAAQAENYSQQELTAALALGVQLDQAIKHGGIRPGDAVLKLILKTMNPSAAPALGYARRNRPSR